MGWWPRRPRRRWRAGPPRAGGGGGSAAALSPQLRPCLRCCREAALARRAEPMLDLEVVPERSLGNEQWEFTLGECGVLPQDPIAGPFIPRGPSHLWSLPLRPLRPRLRSSSGSRHWILPPTSPTLRCVARLGPDASPRASAGPLPGQCTVIIIITMAYPPQTLTQGRALLSRA